VLEVAGADDLEEDEAAAGVFGAARSIAERTGAFRRVVDDDEEFSPVAFFAASASHRHCVMLPSGSGPGKRRCSPADEADDVLDAFQDRARDGVRAGGAVEQDRIDVRRIGKQAAHLAGDRR